MFDPWSQIAKECVARMAAVTSQFCQNSIHELIRLTERSALSGVVSLFVVDGILSTNKIKYRKQDLIAIFIG
jgi:hypothetical protein